MKKISIFLIASVSLLNTNAQTVLKPSNGKTTATVSRVKNVQDNVGTSSPSTALNKGSRGTTFPSLVGTKMNTGSSTYDLQTNGSMPRRIVQNGNQISCGWTFSTEIPVDATAPFADRGTGYANFNGTTWSAAPLARIEPNRTGFGGIAIDGSGKEVYIPHDGSNNSLYINRKTGTTWSTTQLTTTTTNQAIWPHFATSGNWMYIVASPADSTIHTNGIRGGYFLSRSNDNGATWMDNMIPMPLVDSVGHYRGGGNSYSISAAGSHVAVLFGDVGSDLTAVISHDYGATWTKKVVWDWPIDHFNFAGTDPTHIPGSTNAVDTIYTNDGSQTCVIDTNGVLHAAFPLVRVYKSGGATTYGFFYNTLLGYYNSVADSVQVVDNIFSLLHDCNADSTFSIGANYISSATPSLDAIYSTLGLITMPSISIVPGTPNKILIAYTAVMDADTTVDDQAHPYWNGASALPGQNYRDVFVVGSQDNGANWTFPVDISKSSHFEEAFVSTPERVTGTSFPVLYQGDIEPGTLMQNDDSYDGIIQNVFICQQVDIADIFTLGTDPANACSQQEMPVGIKNVISTTDGIVSAYPNPANDIVNLSIRLVNPSATATINVVDVTGSVVYNQKLTNVSNETVKIPVKNLTAGVYLIKLETTAGTITRKFVKE